MAWKRQYQRRRRDELGSGAEPAREQNKKANGGGAVATDWNNTRKATLLARLPSFLQRTIATILLLQKEQNKNPSKKTRKKTIGFWQVVYKSPWGMAL